MKCTPWSYQSTDELYHYGILHRSGRYPYGSGDRPYQRDDVKVFQRVGKHTRKEHEKQTAADAHKKWHSMDPKIGVLYTLSSGYTVKRTCGNHDRFNS